MAADQTILLTPVPTVAGHANAICLPIRHPLVKQFTNWEDEVIDNTVHACWNKNSRNSFVIAVVFVKQNDPNTPETFEIPVEGSWGDQTHWDMKEVGPFPKINDELCEVYWTQAAGLEPKWRNVVSIVGGVKQVHDSLVLHP